MTDQPIDFETAWARTSEVEGDVAVAVFEEVRRQLEFEHGIRDKLDRKAQVTLLANTLTSSFMAFLPLPTQQPLRVSFLAAVAVGVTSSLLALIAFGVDQSIRQARFEDIFSEEALKSKTSWHRWMATHIFSVVEEQHLSNDKRAAWVQWAMRAFALYLMAIAVAGVLAVAQ